MNNDKHSTRPKAIVVGAGAGGLSAAIALASKGAQVTLLEKSDGPGGKIRTEMLAGRPIDAGPTVFTMRWMFDELFRDAGAEVEDYLHLRKAALLARHAWRQGGTLDLFPDIQQSADAIEAFAGPGDAQGYRRFAARSASIFETLRNPFMKEQKPSKLDVVRRVGLFGMPSFVINIRPMITLWRELHRYFSDPRLIQLFGRYATYVGSSPFQTPATIMLIAHAEREGVWSVDGGMAAVAQALASLAIKKGVTIEYGAKVESINVSNGKVAGVTTEQHGSYTADLVIFNGDKSALGHGMLGNEVKTASTVTKRPKRSLSAVTACLVGKTNDFDLAHHTVFFDDDYRSEFEAVFQDRRLPEKPTVYVCAQDRAEGALGVQGPSGKPHERIFLLTNAPADGDEVSIDTNAAFSRATGLMSACGLDLQFAPENLVLTGPQDFNDRFPATGGALYGETSHGMTGTLDRAGTATNIQGLFLAGGSVHPGPGVPMAVMSGRLAADQAILAYAS
ncbi:MAG: 1-hydroxycarotenoid 3,4-desaturase CrtD [Pseudomonadota bacterium]